MQYTIILLLVHLVIFYNKYELTNALVGRNVREAQEGEFPNIVCILRVNNNTRRLTNDVRCTGTLITRSHILSSEHCFNNVGTHALYVLVDAVDLRLGTPYYIAWWISYNVWAATEGRRVEYYVNDIVIIKLNGLVPNTILPALISPDDNTHLYGLNVTLAGWGRLADDRHPYVMHTTQVTIISNSDCETIGYRVSGKRSPLAYRYLCTIAEPWALVNAGDSGGPMFFGSFIIGINQGTFPKTDTIVDRRKANLHCTVDYYRIFINRNMRI